jgi:hypothetical protein
MKTSEPNIYQIVRIPDDALAYHGLKVFDECKRIGWRLAEEWSTITYRPHTWKLAHAYRIQGNNGYWSVLMSFPDKGVSYVIS